MEFLDTMTPMEEPAIKDSVLYEFLCKALKGNQFKVYQLAGDASARRYYRVIDGNKSWVIMEWKPFKDDGSYPLLSVHKLFSYHNIQVPKIIKKSASNGLILLEDLGDLTLERKFWDHLSQELSYPFYQLAIDELIKIHFHTQRDKIRKSTAFTTEFDCEKFMWEMRYGLRHLSSLCKFKVSKKTSTELEVLFEDICGKLAKEPKYISHRDYHSRNLMITMGEIRVIDFQDARLGPIQYDLVSLINDSYVELDKDLGKDLVGYYLERRASLGLKKISWDEFNTIFEIQSIQRCFKACGSFASFYNNRQDTRYLKYLHLTLGKVRESLKLFKEYSLFETFLEDNGLFEAKFDF